MAAVGGCFFYCMDFWEILQNSCPRKRLVRYWNNFTGLFLGWPFSKIVHEILIRRKTWPRWGGGDFLHYMDIKKFLKNLLRNRWSEFGIISQDCVWPFKTLFSKFWSVKKHGCSGGGFFRSVDFREILQNSSPLKLLVRFWNNFGGLYLGWPFSKIVREILIRRKTWPPGGGGGFFALYEQEEIPKKSSSLKPLVRFEII